MLCSDTCPYPQGFFFKTLAYVNYFEFFKCFEGFGVCSETQRAPPPLSLEALANRLLAWVSHGAVITIVESLLFSRSLLISRSLRFWRSCQRIQTLQKDSVSCLGLTVLHPHPHQNLTLLKKIRIYLGHFWTACISCVSYWTTEMYFQCIES